MISAVLKSELLKHLRPGVHIRFCDLINVNDNNTPTHNPNDVKKSIDSDLADILRIVYRDFGKVSHDGRKYYITDITNKIYDIQITKTDTYIQFFDSVTKKKTVIEYCVNNKTEDLQNNLIQSLSKTKMNSKELINFLNKFIAGHKG